jgi:hypothetical protein
VQKGGEGGGNGAKERRGRSYATPVQLLERMIRLVPRAAMVLNLFFAAVHDVVREVRVALRPVDKVAVQIRAVKLLQRALHRRERFVKSQVGRP